MIEATVLATRTAKGTEDFRGAMINVGLRTRWPESALAGLPADDKHPASIGAKLNVCACLSTALGRMAPRSRTGGTFTTG